MNIHGLEQNQISLQVSINKSFENTRKAWSQENCEYGCKLFSVNVSPNWPEPPRTHARIPTLWTCDEQKCGVVGESIMYCAAGVYRLGPWPVLAEGRNSVACVERARRGRVLYLRRLPVQFAFWTVISALSKAARRVQMI